MVTDRSCTHRAFQRLDAKTDSDIVPVSVNRKYFVISCICAQKQYLDLENFYGGAATIVLGQDTLYVRSNRTSGSDTPRACRPDLRRGFPALPDRGRARVQEF
eukprot:COSAG05_NODE_897_length_6692_cov_5.453966_4_plen_103_part_00